MRTVVLLIVVATLGTSRAALCQNNGEGGAQEIKSPATPVKVETSTTTKPSPVGQPVTTTRKKTGYKPPQKSPTTKKEPPTPGK
jgi:hypothetical protein